MLNTVSFIPFNSPSLALYIFFAFCLKLKLGLKLQSLLGCLATFLPLIYEKQNVGEDIYLMLKINETIWHFIRKKLDWLAVFVSIFKNIALTKSVQNAGSLGSQMAIKPVIVRFGIEKMSF